MTTHEYGPSSASTTHPNRRSASVQASKKALLNLWTPTPKQAEILRAIETHLCEHGTAPTIRELDPLRSTATLHKHLTALCKKGYLTAAHRRARSYLPTTLAFAFLAAHDVQNRETKAQKRSKARK